MVTNRLFRVNNTARVGAYVVALDSEQAVAVALHLQLVKAPKNATVQDVTEAYAGAPGLNDLLAGPPGFAFLQLAPMRCWRLGRKWEGEVAVPTW